MSATSEPEIPHVITAPKSAFASVEPREPVFRYQPFGPAEPVKHYLVVATYNENVAWAAMHRGWWNLQIVRKDVDVANKGREASSYLWWIVQNYDKLRDGDHVAFVQGNPYDHCPQFDEYLRGGVLFGPTLACDRDGFPHHGGLRASIDKGREIFSIHSTWELRFVAGAQFMVNGRTILSHDKSKYERALEWSMEDKDAPWAMERLWCAIFKL